MRKRRINRGILAYISQIMFVLVFVLVSFMVIKNSNLTSYASIAKYYSNTNQDLQVLYGKYDKSDLMLLNQDNLLDKGTLSIKNPNESVVPTTVIFTIDISSTLDKNSVTLEVDGEEYDLRYMTLSGDKYILEIGNINIESYDTVKYDIELYATGYANKGDYLNYSFNVNQSFFN